MNRFHLNQKIHTGAAVLFSALLFFCSSYYLKPIWSFAHVSGYILILLAALPVVLVSRNERITSLYFAGFILFVLISGFSGALSRQTQGLL